MIVDGEPKPCKPIPMKNVEDIIKGISGFIHYWGYLRVANVRGLFCHQYGTWIGYWTRACYVLTPSSR